MHRSASDFGSPVETRTCRRNRTAAQLTRTWCFAIRSRGNAQVLRSRPVVQACHAKAPVTWRDIELCQAHQASLLGSFTSFTWQFQPPASRRSNDRAQRPLVSIRFLLADRGLDLAVETCVFPSQSDHLAASIGTSRNQLRCARAGPMVAACSIGARTFVSMASKCLFELPCIRHGNCRLRIPELTYISVSFGVNAVVLCSEVAMKYMYKHHTTFRPSDITSAHLSHTSLESLLQSEKNDSTG